MFAVKYYGEMMMHCSDNNIEVIGKQVDTLDIFDTLTEAKLYVWRELSVNEGITEDLTGLDVDYDNNGRYSSTERFFVRSDVDGYGNLEEVGRIVIQEID